MRLCIPSMSAGTGKPSLPFFIYSTHRGTGQCRTIMQAQEILRQLRIIPELDDLRQYVRSFPTNALMGMGAFAAITTYWFASRPKALKAPCDLGLQSVEIPDGERARRSTLNDSEELLTHYYSDGRTMYEVLQRGIRVSNDGPCLGSRKPNQPYEWQSYREVADRAEHIGSALVHRGHAHTGDKYIGIFSQNRPEWTISELACYTYSLVAVPLYDTLGTEAIGYVIDKAAISTVICDIPEKARMILDCVSGKGRTIKTIVLIEAFDDELAARAKECGVEILSLKEFEALGKANLKKPVPPKPEDLALICFTSGTTGDPKGAMLTHGNVISNTAAFIKITEGTLKPNSKDVLISFLPLAHMFERVVEINCMLSLHDIHISYLPLAHMFERVVQCVVLTHGARIGYFQGDIRLLMDDLKTLRPTIFPVVPRLLNRMFDKVFSQANTPLKKWLLDFAFRRKEADLKSGVVRRDSMWDKLIFRKVQASLGGRVRLMITGAAPVSPTILTFLRAALGCQFYEGYGQTECTAGCTMSCPVTGQQVTSDLLCPATLSNWRCARNELPGCQRRGRGVCQRTKRDIGKWLPNGTLKITDRKKHIFKLAQGEYIAPEKIETVYNLSDPVAQIFVHGDSLQACLVGIVVPDPDFLPIWIKKKGIEGSYSELCKSKEVKDTILQDLLRLGKEAGLKSFEQVRDITLHPEMFSVQNGLLTPTLKAKRAELRQRFREHIDELYAKIKM
ncbi:Long-chain-fatty-acid--CoA ligase 1 [Larimichthys crocea]|uniref:Long-chain-fatty-acid--CoA ligase n=1 Tax=Larimichthys crocea TaxID=215358 RepID=A0A6G0J9F3_LARCR|nr:Long-chain-fatty-acid--CoA ligase 1 [Larimichthys crocea]